MSSFPITETAENCWAEVVTIAAGTSKSDAICTQGHQLVGIQMPAAWTAASIGFDCSIDSLVFQTTLDNNATLVQEKVAASQFIVVPLAHWIISPYIKLKSVVAASDTPTNQVAAATLTLLFRRVQGGQ